MNRANEPPLVVDLDGTLLRSDLLVETALSYVRASPHRFLLPLLWLWKGKAYLKEVLAQSAELDVTVLPYDQEVIELILTEREQGRKIVLATASHRILAERVANHLGVFDEVIATEGQRNLSARQKMEALTAAYGQGGYDYAGNAHDDLSVWKAARHAIVINPEIGLEGRIGSLGNVIQILRTGRSGLGHWSRAFRFHQWVKNLLIFVPLLAAHQLADVHLLWQGVLAFVAFGLCASSVYVLNDLLDIGDDRHHLTKKFRPFAAGDISIKAGVLIAPLLLVASIAISLTWLPISFAQILGGYYLLTLGYSLVLKRHMVVDVIALASLYTVRVIAGSSVFAIALSFWMLAFSMFMFLSLALVKRYAELHHARVKGATRKSRGRGYYPSDLEMIASLGGSAGYMAVLVLALYINDLRSIGLYQKPELIWLACPLLLFWISRVWMLAHRGQMHEDPVVFAVRDRVSLYTGALFGLVFWAAT